MEKHTKGEWRVVKSQSKPAFNVISTIPGAKYKIARCPYVDYSTSSQEVQDREIAEAQANAALIASAPSLLQENKKLRERVQELEDKLRGLEYAYAVSEASI